MFQLLLVMWLDSGRVNVTLMDLIPRLPVFCAVISQICDYSNRNKIKQKKENNEKESERILC